MWNILIKVQAYICTKKLVKENFWIKISYLMFSAFNIKDFIRIAVVIYANEAFYFL